MQGMAQPVRAGEEERRMQSDERHCISTSLLKWTSSPHLPLHLPDPSHLTPSQPGSGAGEGQAAKYNRATDSGSVSGSLANAADMGELLGGFMSMMECATLLGIHGSDFF